MAAFAFVGIWPALNDYQKSWSQERNCGTWNEMYGCQTYIQVVIYLNWAVCDEGYWGRPVSLSTIDDLIHAKHGQWQTMLTVTTATGAAYWLLVNNTGQIECMETIV